MKPETIGKQWIHVGEEGIVMFTPYESIAGLWSFFGLWSLFAGIIKCLYYEPCSIWDFWCCNVRGYTLLALADENSEAPQYYTCFMGKEGNVFDQLQKGQKCVTIELLGTKIQTYAKYADFTGLQGFTPARYDSEQETIEFQHDSKEPRHESRLQGIYTILGLELADLPEFQD